MPEGNGNENGIQRVPQQPVVVNGEDVPVQPQQQPQTFGERRRAAAAAVQALVGTVVGLIEEEENERDRQAAEAAAANQGGQNGVDPPY